MSTGNYPYHFMHSCYVDTGRHDALIICEFDGKQKRLNLIQKPMMEFWITRPEFRNHSAKKESAPKQELDRYQCLYKERFQSIADALGEGWRFKNRPPGPSIMNNPYVYGADIDIDTRYKMKYRNAVDLDHVPTLNCGFLDIETSVIGGQEVILNTFMHIEGTHVYSYTAILSSFLPENGLDRIKLGVVTDIDPVIAKQNKRLHDKLNLPPLTFDFVFEVCTNEEDVIQWIFDRIHEHKTTFIGIWNMQYDTTYFINRLEHLGISPADVFCHPEVPEEFRMVQFQEDRSKLVAHFSEKWHTIKCPGYTQWFDSMSSYSRLRKVSGKLTSYALDNVANIELGVGKMDTGKGHHWMQKNDFVGYTIYNIIDVLLLVYMEIQNHDLETVYGLCGTSTMANFPKQTGLLRDEFTVYCNKLDRVPCACSGEQKDPFIMYYEPQGGAVLNPNLAPNVGAPILDIVMNTISGMCIMVSDLDVSSMYPSIRIAFGIAKETRLVSVLRIYIDIPLADGSVEHRELSVEDYFANITSTKENAVYLCKNYYNLPDYGEMEDLFAEFMKTKNSKGGDVTVSAAA